MIQKYLKITRRWIWLLILASLVTGVNVYFIVLQQSQTYSASARLIIGPGLESLNPDLDELRTAGMLMQTYAELMTTTPMLESVIRELNLQMSPIQLKNTINLKADETTRILTIDVQANHAAQALDTANAIASILVSLGPAGAEETTEEIRSQTLNQISFVEQDIARLEAESAQLEETLAAATNREERRIYTDQLSLKRAQLAEASRTVIMLLESLQQTQTNRVRIIEPATSAILVNPELELTVLMAAIAGFILALAVVLLLEYIVDTVRDEDDLVGLTDIPLLGTIAKHKPLRNSDTERLIVRAVPESRTVENYRMLASKLLLTRYKATTADNPASVGTPKGEINTDSSPSQDRPLRSLLISGTHISSSSEVAANLAVILAQTGHRVILVDAYLHQPVIGQLFGMAGRGDLTSLLRGTPLRDQLTPVSSLPTLSLLLSGPAPTSSFELLASTRMTDLIHDLERQADLVIVAASPLLLFADSLVLASRVDGVVVVAHSGVTRRATLVDIVESLHTHGAAILGMVLDQNQSHRQMMQFKPKTSLQAAQRDTRPVQKAGGVLK